MIGSNSVPASFLKSYTRTPTHSMFFMTSIRSLWHYLKGNDSDKFQNWNIESERKNFLQRDSQS